MDKAYIKQYNNYIRGLNALIKGKKSKEEIFLEFEKFKSLFVPAPVQRLWNFRPGADWGRDVICVLAHSNRPIRTLALLNKNSDVNKDIPEIRYTFRRVMYRKLHATELFLDPESKKAHDLYTEKRGFWMILQPSVENIIHLPNNHAEASESTLEAIFELYTTFVHGMEMPPSDESLIQTGTEQFDVNLFPTAPWKESVLNNMTLKKEKIRREGKRKREHVMEEDHHKYSKVLPETGTQDWIPITSVPFYGQLDKDLPLDPEAIPVDLSFDLFGLNDNAIWTDELAPDGSILQALTAEN